MKKLIKRYKLSIIFLFVLMITSILFTTFEYIGINYIFLTRLELLLSLIYVFIYSYIKASKSLLKGYKIGIKSGLSILILFTFINIITLNALTIRMIIYYIFILLISIISSIMQKNKRKN